MRRKTGFGLSLFAGSVLALLGALLVVRTAFGTAQFVAGLALHLLGMAICLGAIGMRSPRPRLSRSIPQQEGAEISPDRLRDVRFRSETQLGRIVLGLTLALYLIPCLWLTAHNLSALFALRRYGRTCQAQIFNKEREAELGNSTTGLVYYSFRVTGVPVTGHFRAARADYGLLRTGQHLMVTYLPGDPRIHRLGPVDAERGDLEGAATLLLVLCGAVYVVGPVVAIERALRRELRLARYGRAITGVIIGSRPVYRGEKRLGHYVRYQFTLSQVGEVTGGARIGQVDGEPTVIGFPITILYDPAQPQQHRPLAAFHRVSFSSMPKSLLAT